MFVSCSIRVCFQTLRTMIIVVTPLLLCYYWTLLPSTYNYACLVFVLL